jgi:hypothetical protein
VTLIPIAVLAVSCAGIVAGATVGLAARSVRAATGSMLELWMAASLLHLTASGSWAAVGGAAILVAVRAMLSRVFRATPRG